MEINIAEFQYEDTSRCESIAFVIFRCDIFFMFIYAVDSKSGKNVNNLMKNRINEQFS